MTEAWPDSLIRHLVDMQAQIQACRISVASMPRPESLVRLNIEHEAMRKELDALKLRLDAIGSTAAKPEPWRAWLRDDEERAIIKGEF